MRTITKLYNEGDIVFIRVRNKLIAQRFLQEALNEGFIVNGKSEISESFLEDVIYKLDDNFALHSISGFAMHMFYSSLCKINDGKTVVRIDYAKYINELDDYIITERKDL